MTSAPARLQGQSGDATATRNPRRYSRLELDLHSHAPYAFRRLLLPALGIHL